MASCVFPQNAMAAVHEFNLAVKACDCSPMFVLVVLSVLQFADMLLSPKSGLLAEMLPEQMMQWMEVL